MPERHQPGPDGLLNDGVDTTAATPADLAMYTQAQLALTLMSPPMLYHADRPHERLYIALFDGTGSDAGSNPEHATTIGRFSRQLEALSDLHPSIGFNYIQGPGTQRDFMPALHDRINGHSYNARMEAMYADLLRQTYQWLQQEPDAQIRVISTGFSRGAEQAAGFSRLLHERGIQNPEDRIASGDAQDQYSRPPLVSPGQVAQAVGLFDPVGTGTPERHDRRLPPSVLSGLQITARDERRDAFVSTRIIMEGLSADGRFLGVLVPGAHRDAGGGYHRNGLSLRSGNLMVDFINAHSSTPLLQKQTEPGAPDMNVIHHSEQHLRLAGIRLYGTSAFTADGLRDEGKPAPFCRAVDDCGPPEPVDTALAARFQRHAVTITPAPPMEEATHRQAAPAQRLLQPGAEGQDVAQLQAYLIQLGINAQLHQPLQVTGHYDQNTRHAVLAFQLQHGTAQISGLADAQTQQAIQAEAAQAKPSATALPLQTGAATTRTAPDAPVPPSLLPYSDARHPEHALYADTHQRLQAQGHQFTEERLNQIAAQLHIAGFSPGWKGDMSVSAGTLHAVDHQSLLDGHIALALSGPAPSSQASMEAAQHYDHALAQLLQNTQQHNGQGHGPVTG